MLGINGEICYDPSLGINIIPHFHVPTSSKDHLSQSQKHFRLPNGQVLDCLGVLHNVLVIVDDFKILIDFHIFDLPGLSFHLTFIGRPIMRILENTIGNEKLDHRIGEDYLPVWSSRPLINGLEVKPVLDLRGELMSISLTAMTHSSLADDLKCHEKEKCSPTL